MAWWLAGVAAALLNTPVGGAAGHTPGDASASTSLDPAIPPHVVWIVVDDLGHADVSYHAGAWATPNIDSLANEGVKLEQYYVQVSGQASCERNPTPAFTQPAPAHSCPLLPTPSTDALRARYGRATGALRY